MQTSKGFCQFHQADQANINFYPRFSSDIKRTGPNTDIYIQVYKWADGSGAQVVWKSKEMQSESISIYQAALVPMNAMNAYWIAMMRKIAR